jgi:polyribonucleotide nucleotidyltransferase
MVESEADQLSEQVMLDAVFFGHEQMQVVIDAIDSFAAEVAVVNSHKQKFNWQAPAGFAGLKQSIESSYGEKIKAAYAIKAKTDRQNELSKLRQEAVAQLVNEEYIESVVKTEFELLEKYIVREQVLNTKTRIDGRDLTTVRNIVPKISLLPKTHGSALFTRGETQALAVCTLGTERDAQVIDSLDGEYRETFMLHYNFPPFSVGECGFFGAPKRREIGHGRLAKRAIVPVLPGIDNFPYVIRVVSEVLESNGSSSMATVCGTSLALMDAGVPIKAPVAGIAMGLVKENDKFAVLSDILGDEDHLGDMDFKVAGTAHGVTALQMDIKIEGIDRNIMDIALTQAKQGRLHILGIMSEVINQARANISGNAPRIMTMQVKADKIKDIIGKGGATIRGIVEKTGVNIDIDDNGLVKISSTDEQAGLDAQKEIEMIVADAEIGKIYDGKVVKIVDFGAFVNFLPGKDGLVHISQLSDARVEKVEDVLAEGQEVRVKVLDVDRQGRIKLSIKEADVVAEQAPQSPEPSQEQVG